MSKAKLIYSFDDGEHEWLVRCMYKIKYLRRTFALCTICRDDCWLLVMQLSTTIMQVNGILYTCTCLWLY